MEDRSQEVLGKYDLRIYNTYRTRGAYVLETDQGLKLLCGYEGGEGRLEFEDTIKQQIAANGYENTDGYVRNCAGSILSVNSIGEKFVIKNWYDGEECNLKKEEKICLATSNLARLHNCMVGIEVSSEQKQCYQQGNLFTILEKRTRELKRVKSYIRERKQKNEFEVCYLSECEQFYQDALDAMEYMKQIPYCTLMCNSLDRGMICHGNYTYHNVFILNWNKATNQLCSAAAVHESDMVATSNFEKAVLGLQITDLYQFIRKAMEKNDWNISMGQNILKEYQKQRTLLKAEKHLLYVLLLYPEKFWKITNYYYNNKKSWIPQKNVQKLITLTEQIDSKKVFLDQLLKV